MIYILILVETSQLNQFNLLKIPLIFFRTPMMDLLIQVTTANKINPGGHVIQVINDRSDDFLYYKPSTPIGNRNIFFIFYQQEK